MGSLTTGRTGMGHEGILPVRHGMSQDIWTPSKQVRSSDNWELGHECSRLARQCLRGPPERECALLKQRSLCEDA